MLRRVLCFLLLFSATVANAAEWKQVGESPTVGVLLADMNTVNRSGDTVTVWLKYPRYKSGADPRIATALVKAEFYCSAHEFQIFNMLLRDKNDKVLYDMMDRHARNGVQTGTVFGSAAEMLCSVAPSR